MMGMTSLRLLCLPILAVAVLGAGKDSSFKEEMQFGIEAAQRGLWREAIFRWEKHLKNHPDDARLRNNLAVAYESLGQFDKALKEYREAVRLDPASKEIRHNYESSLELCKSLKTCAAESEAVPPPPPAKGGRL
jgi:Flp pilus assembly protein TadD